MDIVLIPHGFEPVEPSNKQRVRHKRVRLPENDEAVERGSNPDVLLVGEVECDEVYIVAGHKGQP